MLPSGNSSAAATPSRKSVSSLILPASGILTFIALAHSVRAKTQTKFLGLLQLGALPHHGAPVDRARAIYRRKVKERGRNCCTPFCDRTDSNPAPNRTDAMLFRPRFQRPLDGADARGQIEHEEAPSGFLQLIEKYLAITGLEKAD
jgi:hypothetical protein